MGAPDAAFEHASAPDRCVALAAGLLKQTCVGVTTDAAEFDVDDAARSQIEGSHSVAHVVDTLIETDGHSDLGLQFGVRVDAGSGPGL